MISHPNGSGQSALCSRHTHTIDAKASALRRQQGRRSPETSEGDSTRRYART